MFRKEQILFIILAGFFITNAIVAEFIGAKLFSLEKTIGILPFSFSFFGVNELSFNLTAGVLLWPVVFIMTDVINEYYGVKGVRMISWLTAGLIAFSFLMVWAVIHLEPASFWEIKKLKDGSELNMNLAFAQVFGQGLWIMIASIIAFLFGQVLDALVFRKIKIITGDSGVWIRATASTLVSQLVDSFVVLFIAFYIGAGWTFKTVLAVMLVNYLYKVFIAIAFIPFLYLVHGIIRRYLGKDLSAGLSQAAIGSQYN